MRAGQDHAPGTCAVTHGARRLILPVTLCAAVALGILPGVAAAQGASSTPASSSTASSSGSPSSSATPQQSGTTTPAQPRPDRILSNESTFTTWTIADENVAIRAQPNSHARSLARLRALTPDGFLQSYILLRERFTQSGPWVQLRVPMRPNGKLGWVPRSALDTFTVTHMSLLVDRETHTLTLYRNGHALLHFPVGVGKPSTPTPAGHFWITESFSSSDAFYGPWAFATSDYSTLANWPGGGIVGVHGTNEPGLIPGNPSHGCIRMLNWDVVRLIRLVQIGTPLHVI